MSKLILSHGASLEASMLSNRLAIQVPHFMLSDHKPLLQATAEKRSADNHDGSRKIVRNNCHFKSRRLERIQRPSKLATIAPKIHQDQEDEAQFSIAKSGKAKSLLLIP